MSEFNTWHDKQEKVIDSRGSSVFAPKWNNDTILWIIDQLNQMVDFVDIQYALVKQYKIVPASASLWIEMSRRVMVDMQNGLTIDQALEKDKERRSLFRRKTAS